MKIQKRMALLFALSAMTATASADAVAISGDIESTANVEHCNPSPEAKPLSVDSLHSLVANPPKLNLGKDEFETTQEYEARIATQRQQVPCYDFSIGDEVVIEFSIRSQMSMMLTSRY